MSFRRRLFQQNRSKSAIEIATDFLLQTRLQDSVKAPCPQSSNLPSPSKHPQSSECSPLACSDQSDAADVTGAPSGAEGLVSKGREDSDNVAARRDFPSPMSTCARTPKSPPASSPSSVTSSQAEGGERDEEQQQQEEEEQEECPTERRSWRKVIFDRVCTTVVPGFSLLNSPGVDDSSSSRKRRRSEVRARWKKATLETLLELRLKKEEAEGAGQEDPDGFSEHRLGYVEISPCPEEVKELWTGLLRSASSSGSPPSMDYHTLLGHVRRGVPRELRGMVWKFLALQQTCHSGAENCSSDMYEVPYSDLLDRFSADQHAILIDLGRTFPGHPLFSKALGSGQVSLFNLLKAYSLLDEEVGYCQGVSFIAGVLLMHESDSHGLHSPESVAGGRLFIQTEEAGVFEKMEEAGAFEMIRHLMLGLGLRTLYCPSMAALQMRLYQMVRLLHDHDLEVFQHLERQEVVPALYATPWFLTLFASQYPLGFVARVFDLLFTQGPDVIFKVALRLLTCHRELILQLDCFEDLVDFLKTGLPEMARIQIERVTDQVRRSCVFSKADRLLAVTFTFLSGQHGLDPEANAVDLDISQQLHNYEIEFHVFRDDMLSASHSAHPGNNNSSNNNDNNNRKCNNNNNVDSRQSLLLHLQHAVLRLQDQKRDLAEQLARAHSELHTLNMAAHRFRLKEEEFKARIRAMELERTALLSTVSWLKSEQVPDNEQQKTSAL